MCRYRFVIAAATAALTGAVSLAGADTPADAPEPRVAEPVVPVVDDEEPPAPEASRSRWDAEPARSQPAQPRPAAPRPLPRNRSGSEYRQGKGWFLGGSLGVGSVTYSEGGISNGSETATFLEARLGGMMTRRLALSAEFWSDGHRNEFDDSLAVTQNCLGLAATYWATPHLWLRAALGTARVTVYRNGVEQAGFEGFAYLMSAGYEIVSRNSLSIDLSLRLLGSSFETDLADVTRSALSLHAGAHWH